jgi:GH43 family beta-xylosidase
MEIILKPKAQNALMLIANFVEKNNTKGSGVRFIEKFSLSLSTYAIENTHYAVCKNKTLSILGFSFITINKWVIAFKIENKKFIIYRIILGALLK